MPSVLNDRPDSADQQHVCSGPSPCEEILYVGSVVEETQRSDTGTVATAVHLSHRQAVGLLRQPHMFYKFLNKSPV